MSKWKWKHERHADGTVHVSKIIRKPEAIGCEILAVADPQMGLVTRIELANSKYADKRVFENEHSKGTAVVLRLAKPWQGSGKIFL